MSYSSPKEQEETSPTSAWLLEGDFDLFPAFSPTALIQDSPQDHTILASNAQGPVDPKVTSPLSSTKRKEADETENTSSTRTKRRIQNRVAQRAFRERKQTYARELETKVQTAQEEVEQLRTEKIALERVLQNALTENQRLQQELERRPPPDPILSALLDRVKSTHTSPMNLTTSPEKQPSGRDDSNV